MSDIEGKDVGKFVGKFRGRNVKVAHVARDSNFIHIQVEARRGTCNVANLYWSQNAWHRWDLVRSVCLFFQICILVISSKLSRCELYFRVSSELYSCNF